MDKRTKLEARLARARQSGGRTTALLVVLVVTMILEASVASRGAGRRMARARYVLLSVWMALMLAQPAPLGGLSLPFIAVLALIVVIAAAVPSAE